MWVGLLVCGAIVGVGRVVSVSWVVGVRGWACWYILSTDNLF